MYLSFFQLTRRKCTGANDVARAPPIVRVDACMCVCVCVGVEQSVNVRRESSVCPQLNPVVAPVGGII